MLFEPDPEYERSIELPYDFGEPFHKSFRLPPNLHVLGTMNTADRSIAIVDLAVPRRFAFATLWPSAQVVEEHSREPGPQAFRELLALFIEHAPEESLTLLPGHSYFLGDTEEQVRVKLRTAPAALFEEYLVQGYVAGFSGSRPRLLAVVAHAVSGRRRTPRASGGPLRPGDISLEDNAALVQPAAELFGLARERGVEQQAARLAEQFIVQNLDLCALLEVSIRRDFDGGEVYLQLDSGNMVGAVPLRSPLTQRFDFGLLVQPRFPWPGIGALLAETGWLVAPAPLRLPLLTRSERRIPPWVLAYMVLARLKTLLDHLERRFEIASENRSAPKGSVNWGVYAARSLPRGAFLAVPCSFPDLRDDRLLQGAIRFTLERQVRSLETQREQGAFVHRLIAFAEGLLRRVQGIAPRRPSPLELDAWLRQPLRSEPLLEGLQAIQWTAEERGLAGPSELEGLPWKMPMEAFFEAWVETVLRRVARSTGAELRVARRRQTTVPLHWDPPYADTQKGLAPDFLLRFEGCVVIVDAKYKRHWEEMRHSAWATVSEETREQHRQDLLQVLAYGSAAGANHTVCCLTYPCSLQTWQSLSDRKRLFDCAEIPARPRRLQLWLTAVPMQPDVESIAAPWIRQLAQVRGAALG
ncbi:MAG: hypothetical protein RMK57_15525 [Bryobacterales bacterium]|nr:hypothetical protein [Bryobacteraceae bacterium]MDW8355932.1 hypothetical protein [Bryobacterales bacterium]